MFCKCANTSNYEVRGLCDPSSIQLSNTTSEAWKEVTVSEIIKVPYCNLPVEHVDKVFITATVTSAKVIETPDPMPENSEGLKLTGKKLVVDLELCQTIIYTADIPEQSVHAIQNTFPYCTFIVLPSTADVDNDQYCVTACIEDVFVKALDPETIFKNSTIFLYATLLEKPHCLI